MMLSLSSLSLIALQNALFVAIATLVVVVAVRGFKLRSTKLQQWLWLIALVPGACLIDFSIRMPISLPTPLASSVAMAKSVSIHFLQGPKTQVTRSLESAHLDLGGKGSESFGLMANDQAGSAQEVGPVRTSPPRFSKESESGSRSSDDHQAISTIAARGTMLKLEQNGGDLEKVGVSSGKLAVEPVLLAPTTAAEHLMQTAWAVPSRLSSAEVEKAGWGQRWRLTRLFSIPSLLMAIWVSGVAMLVIRLVLQWLLLQLQLKEATSAPAAWQRTWRRVLAERRLDRPIRLLRHSNLGPFLTVTPLGAVVVVPDDYWEELSESERKAVLRHELRHYERGDLWLSIVADLLLIPQWFNPLAWYARRRLDECIELNCDEQSLNNMEDRAVFAKALLKLVEFPSFRWSGAKAAKSSSIGNRIRRLLMPSVGKDARWLQFCTTTSTILVAGLVLIRFEASATPAITTATGGTSEGTEQPAEASTSTDLVSTVAMPDSDIDEFARRLDLKNDTTGKLKQLAEALKKEAGKIVALERASNYEDQLRERAESEPIPGILRNYFEQEDGRYVLKANQKIHAEQFMKDCQIFEADTASIDGLLKSMAARLDGSDEAAQLVVRFLKEPIAATVIYCDWVQAEVRPDYRAALEQLEDYFVVNRDGKLISRPGSSGVSEEVLRQLERVQQIGLRLQRDLAEWSSDLSQKHPLSSRIREAMSHPSLAMYIALDHAEDDYSIDQVIEDYFEYVEYMFHDRADGLVPNEDREAEWKERLHDVQTMRIVGERLQPILARVAANLDASDEIGQRWQKLLPTQLVSYWLASEMGVTSTDAKENAENYLMEFFSETGDGKLALNPERQEELQDRIRDWLREGRSLRRRGAEIAAFADQLADPKLSAAYKSTAGKSLVLRLLRSELAREYFDGLGAWIDEHFEETDDGYLLKEGHEWEIDGFLQRTEEIEKESENNDF